MANVHRAGLVCAAVAGSLIVGVSGPLANAQKPPVPSVAPAAPAVLQQQPSPVVPNVAGIAVGSPMSVVDAKCKEAGVTCIRGTRKTKSHTLDRVRIELPASSPFMRAYVTAKAGTVFAIKGTFRADDSTRFQTMEKGLGKSTPSRGVAAWTTPANGVVTQLGHGGRSVRYIDTKAANAKGIAFSPQDFIKKLDRPLSLAPEAAPSAGGFGPIKPAAVALAPVANATVTQTLRVPVKITLKQLQCWVENDLTSIVYGDDPYLYITGTHTNTMTGKPWYVRRGFSSDVEAGGILDINLPIFDDSDPERRALTFGEALGVQFSLYEDDTAVDDEIDFGYPIIDYTFAVNNQNKTLERVEKLGGDGAIYYLTYKIEIGAAQQDIRRGITSTHKFRAVDAKLFAGSFVGTIGDQPGELALSHLASFDPAYPNGAVHGSLKDGGVTASVRTQRLQGDSLELVIKYPSGSLGLLNGYLIGTGSSLRIAGTIVRDGTTRGVLLAKK